MTDIQDLLKQYTTIDAQDTITPAMIDDWLLSELSTAIYTSKLPRIAPRPIHTADTNYISLNSKRPSDASEDEIALKRQKNTDAARRSSRIGIRKIWIRIQRPIIRGKDTCVGRSAG
ncbi:hypothetical protein RMCBS344292_06911 [Rhizopus microsporus]|nr:hypothetical protein RMCBS344292_06911 [Rhizopus microsporus]